MNKLFKKILMLATVMVVSLTAGIFASCSYGLDQEQKKKEEGYKYTVTYDANGGTFGANLSVTYALVKENSPAPAPGYVDATTQASVKVPTRRDYQLVGEVKAANDSEANSAAMQTKSWFKWLKDENGNFRYEEDGLTPLLDETPWDFIRGRVTEDMTLVAKWTKVYRYIICLTETVEEEGVEVQKEKELRSYTVQPGTTILDKLYKKNAPVRRADYVNFSVTGYTILDFYLDAELTEQMPMNYAHPGTVEGSNDVKVYVKYLKGSFEIISNDNIRTLTGTSNWYLVEDIDLSNTTWDMQSSFTGKIYGNGYAFKNATITSNAMKPSGEYKQHSIFGTMNGVIEDVTFENFTVKVQTQYNRPGIVGEQRIAFLAYSVGERGEFKNVTLKDCTLSYKDTTYYTSTFGETALFYVTPATEKAQITILKDGNPSESIDKIIE